MLNLLKIDLKKQRNYKAFWVLSAIYAFLIMSIPATVLKILQMVKIGGGNFDKFDPMLIPVLHFPDIWQNVTYVYGFVKIFLAIIVIMSVSNEFSYKTVRQNVIDGFSRVDFMKSKLFTIVFLSLCSTFLVFFTGLVTGMVSSPEFELARSFGGVEFVLAYFLELLTYLTLAFLITLLVKRAALAIFTMLLLTPIEGILDFLIIRGPLESLSPYLPMNAMDALIPFPFSKYWFQEIQDYVAMSSVALVLAYLCLFIYLIYYKLKTTDL